MDRLLYIGTSGWDYQDWHGDFYPSSLSKKKLLSFYSQEFSTVEINNTFYAVPSVSTVSNWASTAPSGFIFSVKMNRRITHLYRLKVHQDELSSFLTRISTLGEKLGPVLIQCPPKFHCDPSRLKAFCEKLPANMRYVFEFRDESWFSKHTYDLISSFGSTICITSLSRGIELDMAGFLFNYIRLHGPTEQYSGSYPASELNEWGLLISKMISKGKKVFCYFNNDQQGHAVRNAQYLISFCKNLIENNKTT